MRLNGTTIPDFVVQRVIARRGNEHCFAEPEPARTALVVIDLQHAFMNDAVGHAVVPAARDTSRASSESGEMLAFDHIPTGATTNTGINIDEVNSRHIKPAVVLTAIGADLETGRATP